MILKTQYLTFFDFMMVRLLLFFVLLGKEDTFVIPKFLRIDKNWSSTMSGKAPTKINSSEGVFSKVGTIDARHASSPWVKVVSIPDPE